MASSKLSLDTINFIRKIMYAAERNGVNQSIIIEKYYGIDAMGMISKYLTAELLKRKLNDNKRSMRFKVRSKSSPLRNQIIFDFKEPNPKRMRLE